MRNFILIIILLVLIAGICATFLFDKKKPDYFNTFQTMQLEFQGEKRTFLVADTTAKQEEGLMNIKKLEGAYGMVFEFDTIQMQSFWNQNTLMPLTLYWMVGNRVVGTSQLPSITESKTPVTVTSPQPVNRVIEVPR